MKSKILLYVILLASSLGLYAQNPLNWRESLYDTNKPSVIERNTVNKTDGNYSIKYIFTDDGTPYMICDTFAVTAGATYNFSIDYLDNDPAGAISARIWFFATKNSAYLNRYTSSATTDSPSWQTVSLTGTVPATATLAYVAIRMSTSTGWAGSATFYADNAKYAENGGTTNLILNGSFENWAPPVIALGSTLKKWRESLFDPNKISTITPDATKQTEGYFSLKYIFTDDGTPYMICDTFNVSAGATYNFSIDYLDNDPAGAISARIWFFATKNSAYLNRYTSSATTDSPSWQTVSLTGTVPATATLAYVAIRMSTSTGWAGSATFNADNAKYTENGGATNMILNPGFEEWVAPTNAPEFLTYKFEGLNPAVSGVVDKNAHKVTLEVPYVTNVTTLVSTFTVPNGVTVKVGSTDQVSGTTANNFSSPVTYTLSNGTLTQDWVVTVNKTAPATGKDIISFKFNALSPAVTGIVNATDHTIAAEVPNSTDVTALVPTIIISNLATVNPNTGLAQNFTSPVTYTVTAQDGSTQAWVVTVTKAAPGQTTLFFEDFENKKKIPSTWALINHDGYIQAAGEERWADSAWVVSTSSRPELVGTQVAMASSYCSNMPLDGKADDWMITPTITLGDNSTLSWQAMSLTSSGNYPDDYKVYIAPALASPAVPTYAYFEAEGNLLIDVAPESWSKAVSRPGTGLSSRSINLKNKVTPSAPNGWFNRNVWIAFVLSTDRYTNPQTGIPNSTAGGSELAIDNIKVVNNTGTTINDNKNNALEMSIFPNPSNGKFKISMPFEKSALAKITVTDIIGRIVYTNQISINAGQNQVDVDLSKIHGGIYLIKTEVEGKTNVSKIIIR